MELIQIIYSILIYGGASLLVVVLFSFWVSKTRQNDLLHSEQSMPVLSTSRILVNQPMNSSPQGTVQSLHPQNQGEQNKLREFSSNPQPQIFPIDRLAQRELKIIRKPTFHTATEHTKESTSLSEKNNMRYTIVNEQMKNAKSRAFNFYL